MKLIIIKLLVLAIPFFVLIGCTKNKSALNLNVSAVQTLYDPADNDSVVLQTSASASLLFDWSPALAADGGIVMYEVAFDLPTGDFSNPIYKVNADNNALSTQATITDKVLNQIAALAGTAPSGTVTLKWTVLVSKGTAWMSPQTSRTITITRTAGFDNPPSNLYMSGAGSEAGQQFTNLGSGEFEIYTKLTAGQTFQFADSTSGSANTYYMGGSDVLYEGTTGSTITTTGVYYIDVNFTMGSVSLTRINAVALWYGDANDTVFSIPYAAQGVWTINNGAVTLKLEGWGWEDRYKFEYFITNPDGSAGTQWWGYTGTFGDAPTTGSMDPSYWYLSPADNTQWDNEWKFDHAFINESAAGPTQVMHINVSVYMQANVPYTHSISQ